MSKKLLPAIFLLFLCLPCAASANAEANAELIALEIRNLSTSVDRLTQLLYEQGRQGEQDAILRKLDIAVAYLNFRSRRIEMFERDLQSTQSLKNRLEDIIRQVETRLEQIEEQEQPNAADSAAAEQSALEIQEQLKMLKLRLGRTDEKIIDYDNRILELRNQLDDVEGFVERHLEL